ncbi:universal stress protein [Kineococcus sp. SYSU DK004]|uniref:universal stress protein n=1 Tax=Kineococcus sp. SYSU DK004 TaxID=3383125 RepID=UPI003D7D2062
MEPVGDGSRAVVVAVEHVRACGAALLWAADEAVLRGATLHLVHVVDEPATAEDALGAAFGWTSADLLTARDGAGWDALRRAEDLVRAHLDRVPGAGPRVRCSVLHGDARRVLLRLADDAALLVTGGPERPGARAVASRPGATSVDLAGRAACPVAVVRRSPSAARGIVVGFDGSPASVAAVRFAAAEADLRAAATGGAETVHLLRVWQAPPDGSPVDRGRAGAGRLPQQTRAAQVAQLRAQAEALARDVQREHPVGVEVRLVEDRFASDVLAEAVTGARLLVVGSRGRGGLLAAVLGSTSHAVLRRTELPVVVVPRTWSPVLTGAAPAGGGAHRVT